LNNGFQKINCSREFISVDGDGTYLVDLSSISSCLHLLMIQKNINKFEHIEFKNFGQ